MCRLAYPAGLVVTLVVTISVFDVRADDASTQETAAGSPSPAEIFDQRILPIFRSPKPSSCVQCHLAAVDLKNYILPSPEKTFASLRDQGLVDLETPEESKILKLIRMGEKDLDRGARLIHAGTRKAEYEAFAAWIRACAADPAMRNLPGLSPTEQARPERPDPVIRHARISRITDSFVRNVWSQRLRCFPCHTPHEIDASNPQHQAALKTMKTFEQKYSSEMLERLKLFRKTPEDTLQHWIATSRQTPEDQLPLLNLKQPRKSLIVLKPTSKLPAKRDDGTFEPPSSSEPVTHMGGLKMHPDDHSYKALVAWIQDYANVVGDRYTSIDELPADNWYPTQVILRVTDAPDDWPEGVAVQLFLHTWNEGRSEWDPDPLAFTQGTVTPRRMINGALFLFGSSTADQSHSASGEAPASATPELRGGHFLVKAYVDTRGRLTDDPTLLLDAADFVGQTEIRKSRWREGFRQATVVNGGAFER